MANVREHFAASIHCSNWSLADVAGAMLLKTSLLMVSV